MNETTERFLKAILERLGAGRIVEIHLFPPIRQGQMETGVAVVAATPPAETDRGQSGAETTDGRIGAEQDRGDAPLDAIGAFPDPGVPSPRPIESSVSALDSRFEVLTAWYRLTRKGPDRGKWEVDLTVEADAPLTTVGAVVRGVQRRLGETIEPERFSVERLRALLDEPARIESTRHEAARSGPEGSERAWRNNRY